MERHIVIGFDGSAASRDALALGVALARAMSATLTLVHAYSDLPGLPAPIPGQMKAEAEKTLRDAAHTVPEDVPTDKRVVARRSPARALYEAAEELDARLIVIGSRRGTAPGHATGGHLAAQVLNGSPCGVAVAPVGLQAQPDPGIHCVGVGVDDGEEAIHAVAASGELALALDARLLVMAAVEAVPPIMSHYSSTIDGLNREAMQAQADEALDRARDAVPLGVAVGGARLEHGDVVELLKHEVAAAHVDLLVVGSRGFGPLRRVLLGSVSGDLMHDTPCGLMVVPRGASVLAGSALAASEAR